MPKIKRNNTKVIYFPFTPNIPWRVFRGKFVLPKLDLASWNEALKNRSSVVIVQGKLLESFLSLFFLEGLNKIAPQKDLFWKGPEIYDELRVWQGLARKFKPELPKDLTLRFPTPLFLDKNKYTFFNCNLNYMDIYSYWGKYCYSTNKFISGQMLQNFTQPITKDYFPKFRNLEVSEELSNLFKINYFYKNQPYVCLFPERTGHSMHKFSGLGWSDREAKMLASYLKSLNIKLIVFSNRVSQYMHTNILSLPANISYIFNLLPSAKAIISEEFDFTNIGYIVSEALIFHKKEKSSVFSFTTAHNFFKKKNKTHEYKSLTPQEVFKVLSEKQQQREIIYG